MGLSTFPEWRGFFDILGFNHQYMTSPPMPYFTARRDGYEISTDPNRLDQQAIHAFLRTSYWAADIDLDTMNRAIDNSLPFGLYTPAGAQAGFARTVTDRARFAWLADVFVLSEHRGLGLGAWLVETVLSHPDVAGLRMVLGTSDAHTLYERFGFTRVGPRLMERPGLGSPVGDTT
jgi:GNAT superfamily N-acetyltransferase